MQVTKSLLIGMAALPWASAFGTMPKKKIKEDRLEGLEDVTTIGEQVDDDGKINGNQPYITIQGGEGGNGEATCAAMTAQPGGSGCYRHITTYDSCSAAADWFRSPAGKNWAADSPPLDPERGEIFDISTHADSSTLPADCYWTKKVEPLASAGQPEPGKATFYFNEGGAAGYGKFDTPTNVRKMVRYVCEYFCPPADNKDCPGTGACYAAGRRDPAPSCSTYTDNSTKCIEEQCTWIC
jgi:hypothetical protein